MDLQAAIAFAAIIFGLAIKPGPGMMAMMSRTMAQGMSACLIFLIGVCLVSLFYMALVFAGLKLAQDDIIFISLLIKSLTAVYLIYLGIKGLQNPDVNFSVREYREEKLFDNLSASIMLTLSNPLVIAVYGAIIPSTFDIADMTTVDMVIAGLIMIFVEVGVAVGYCLPIALTRKSITPTMLRKVSIFSSIVLIIVGLFIGASALPAKDLLSLK